MRHPNQCTLEPHKISLLMLLYVELRLPDTHIRTSRVPLSMGKYLASVFSSVEPSPCLRLQPKEAKSSRMPYTRNKRQFRFTKL